VGLVRIHSADAESRPTALLLLHMLPVCSVVAPCRPGASSPSSLDILGNALSASKGGATPDLYDETREGEDIRLIAPRHRHVPLRLHSAKSFPDGVIQVHYSVRKSRLDEDAAARQGLQPTALTANVLRSDPQRGRYAAINCMRRMDLTAGVGCPWHGATGAFADG
jgi:hypothetical protein